jgi:DNA polymerase (family X)
MHSTWSDGKDSIEQMTKACRDLGYAYCVITDHSRSTRIAGGLTVRELQQQWEEIQGIRDRVPGIHLLAGAEVDILADGSLDYPDNILEQLDVVVASIHAKLQMTKSRMTTRVIKALSHPMVDILGHPTERQINIREPIALDLEEVMHAAKAYDVALELNAQPKRLDLDDRYVRQAKEMGVKIAINSDAHSTDNLHFMHYGIHQARRGWLEPGDVINTMDWASLQQWLYR